MDTLILPNVMKFCILTMPHIFPFKKKRNGRKQKEFKTDDENN